MNTYLLTWNPNRWQWKVNEVLVSLKSQGFFDGRWSCGRTKRIAVGDRLYLLRQGREPRGIMASGYARSSPRTEPHWEAGREGEAIFVDVRFDALLVPEEDGVLPLDQLRTGPLAAVNWRTQASGISINPQASLQLNKLWNTLLEERGQSPVLMPEEVSSPRLYFEGACRSVTVNIYERDPRARKACMEHYGAKCFVCGFDFGAVYGSLGEGFIHVHHLIPLSDIREAYALDPVLHLRPVCPNCHAMLHRGSEVMSIEKLQEVIQSR